MSRFLHTMIRVGDLQRSVDFYTKAFGMKELRRRDVPYGKYTLAFVGFGNEDNNTAIELTYNYGVEKYEMGGAFGHLAVGARADLILLDAPSHVYLAYRPGVPQIAAVWQAGRLLTNPR